MGVMADEAPWAMHYDGHTLNPVNTFGYTVLGFQALNERLMPLERWTATVEERMAALEEANRILSRQLVAAGIRPEA